MSFVFRGYFAWLWLLVDDGVARAQGMAGVMINNTPPPRTNKA